MKNTNRRLIPFIVVMIISILACGPTAAIPTPDLVSLQTFAAQTISAMQTGLVPQVTLNPGVVASDTPQLASTTDAPTFTPMSTLTSAPTAICDRAEFVSETVPDHTVFTPTAAFTKTWRVKNAGTCTWNSSYAIVFDSGVKLGAADVIPFPGTVAPGQDVDLSINMAAPAAEGSYESYWKFRNSSGVLFVTVPFSAKIKVVIPTATSPIILPPPAIMPSTSQVYNQVSVASGSTGSSYIACPAGTKLTGGGFALNESMVAYTHSADSNGWTAYAKMNGPSSAGTTSQIYTQVSIPAGNNGNALATCPAGSVVTGGGFGSSADIIVYTSVMTGNGWQVYANNPTGVSKLLNSYAICLAGTTGTTSLVYAQKSIAAGGYDGTMVACPAGTVLTGGGFAGSTSLWVYNTSMGSSTSWEAYAKNISGSSALLNAYGICLDP
jgi:hypothetical protein